MNRRANWALLILILSASAWSHLSRSSSVSLDLRDHFVEAELRLPIEELEVALNQSLLFEPALAIARHRAQLEKYIVGSVRATSFEGVGWSTEIHDLRLENENPTTLPVVILHLIFRPPPGASDRWFQFECDWNKGTAPSLPVLISLRSDWRGGVFRDHPKLLGALHSEAQSIVIDRRSGSEWRGFTGIFTLGMKHIADGSDHLLFLLMLLLPAPLLPIGRRWRDSAGLKKTVIQVASVVTAFTLGHSVTLMIGAVGLFKLPSQLVEVLIAVSILISALHALRPIFPRREWMVASVFGLIHGLAFASAISDLGLSSLRLALAIFGFNLGIEAVHLALVIAIVPWLILLSRMKIYSLVRTMGASAGVLISIYWILERAVPGLHMP